MAVEENQAYHAKYSNSWALIIGINEYKHASPLGYAKNDAEAVAKILEGKFKFPKSNISLLIDKDATIDAIKKTFFEYTKGDRIKPNDRLLVFFAGHGHTITGKRGEVGFLVPVDGKLDDINSLIRWDDLTRGSDLVPAKHIFFLMDACYGGLALLRGPSFGSMRFLGDMLQRYARQVLTAGKADETVADGNGIRPGHSIFTAHLLDALDGSASTEDGVITANGVMAYVYDRVARDQYSHQTPHYGFIEGDGDFIFDTSILDSKKLEDESSSEGSETAGRKGEYDILINTSPQITTPFTPEIPITGAIKELLSDPAKKIELYDFISLHIRRFLDATDLRHFPVQGSNIQKEDFIERLHKYEELTKDLEQIVILLAKWGDKDQIQLLEKIFTRIAEADKGASGVIVWLRLTWYPIQILMYSAGISALEAKNYDALKIILETKVRDDSNLNNDSPLVVPVGSNLSEIHDKFNWLPGHEKHYVPRSEHLFKALQPVLEDLLFLGRSYEQLFDSFEVLFALVYVHVTQFGWGPFGRFGWKHKSRLKQSPFNVIVEDARNKRGEWGPIKAGLFDGSLDKFLEDAEAYGKKLDDLHWH